MNQKSVMTHQFSQVPSAEIPRSSFDRSHGLKTTFDAGQLIPIFVDEALPGDTFNLNMTGFARLATPIKPIMDNMFMETFFFAVPIRLLWDNWQKFNGEQSNPGDSTDFLLPKLAAAQHSSGGLSDYFGLPTLVPDQSPVSLWHRAYNLIFNEWFRDQNLTPSLSVPTGDGPDTVSAFVVRRRGKRHDYFTSCLPFPQKGDSVDLPLGSLAPIFTTSIDSEDIVIEQDQFGLTNTHMDAISSVRNEPGEAVGDVNLFANLSEASAATINELRQAFQIQKLFERDARGGTRYTEIIRAHFGVTSPDARLQRPEFLGGGSSPINITPVPQTTPEQTAPDPNTTAQGNLAGFGTVALHNHGFTKSFTEHCVLLGLVNVRADLTYQQGKNRMWNRSTRFDFYWPALSQIGEQAVLNKEIFAQGTADDELVFGYQERYAEYRYKPSTITGKFRSNDPASLDVWHLSQDFEDLPLLNNSFIEDAPPIDRVIAVPAEPHFLFDGYFNLRCARPMPLYGVPGMIDHF